MTESKTNLIDLYRLLELSPLENDSAKIQMALKRVLKIAKEAKDPQVAKRATKLLELGKQNLLSADRKAAYDDRWQGAYGSQIENLTNQPQSQSAKATSECEEIIEDWNWDELVPALPQGEYQTEFDLPAFLEHAATLPPQNIAADYAKLQMLLGGEPTVSAEPNLTTPATPAVATAPQQPIQTVAATEPSNSVSQPALQPANPQPSATTTTAAQPPTAQTASSPRSGSMASKLRKKRDKSLLMTSLGLLASVAILLGLIFFLVNRNQEGSDSLAGQPNPQNNAPERVVQPQASAPQTPVRSGLQIPNMPEELNPSPTTPPDPEPQPEATPPQVEPTPPSMTPTPTMTDAPEMTPQPEMTPEPEPTLTADERNVWIEKLRTVCEQLGQQQYPAANATLQALQAEAKTRAQKEELSRLATVAKLATECHQALLQSISNLGPAETFQIGSRTAAFVEGDSEKIIVKMGGANIGGQSQTFKLTELPLGLFEGLVDLTLDVTNETALAKRAAFVLFHPKNNDLTLNKAKTRMETAEEAGSVPQGTVEIFEAEFLVQ